MEIKKMGDLMIPLEGYPHINHRATLLEAMRAIEEAKIDYQGRRSLPRVLLVFDDIHQLVGLVRRRDILRGLEPNFLSTKSMIYRKKLFDVEPDPNLTEIFYEKIVRGMREKADLPVIEVMSPVAMWVDYEDHLGKAIFEMVVNNISLLPVIKNEKVVGVVRTVDIFREVHRLITEN